MNDSQFNSTDRLRGLLTLAAQPQLEMTTCPSNIQLLKFMEGQLSVDAEEQLLQHFQACPECYRKWQEVASEVAVHEHEFEPQSSRLTSLYHRIQLFLRETQKRFPEWPPARQLAWVAIPALALVVTWHVLLTPTVPPTPSSDLLQQLNESIQVVQTIQPQLSTPSQGWPWEGTSGYAFSTSKTEPAIQALQIGLEIGKQKLLGEDLTATLDTQVAVEWQDYVTLGQWTVLLWVVCETKPTLPKSFWDTQQKIVATLQTGFQTRPATDGYAKIMLPHLEQIAKGLSTVALNQNYVPLKTAVEVVMKVR